MPSISCVPCSPFSFTSSSSLLCTHITSSSWVTAQQRQRQRPSSPSSFYIYTICVLNADHRHQHRVSNRWIRSHANNTIQKRMNRFFSLHNDKGRFSYLFTASNVCLPCHLLLRLCASMRTMRREKWNGATLNLYFCVPLPQKKEMIITYPVPMCVIYSKQKKAKKESEKRFSVTNRKEKIESLFFFCFQYYYCEKVCSEKDAHVERLSGGRGERKRQCDTVHKPVDLLKHMVASIVGEILVIFSVCRLLHRIYWFVQRLPGYFVHRFVRLRMSRANDDVQYRKNVIPYSDLAIHTNTIPCIEDRKSISMLPNSFPILIEISNNMNSEKNK